MIQNMVYLCLCWAIVGPLMAKALKWRHTCLDQPGASPLYSTHYTPVEVKHWEVDMNGYNPHSTEGE